ELHPERKCELIFESGFHPLGYRVSREISIDHRIGIGVVIGDDLIREPCMESIDRKPGELISQIEILNKSGAAADAPLGVQLLFDHQAAESGERRMVFREDIYRPESRASR